MKIREEAKRKVRQTGKQEDNQRSQANDWIRVSDKAQKENRQSLLDRETERESRRSSQVEKG